MSRMPIARFSPDRTPSTSSASAMEALFLVRVHFPGRHDPHDQAAGADRQDGGHDSQETRSVSCLSVSSYWLIIIGRREGRMKPQRARRRRHAPEVGAHFSSLCRRRNVGSVGDGMLAGPVRRLRITARRVGHGDVHSEGQARKDHSGDRPAQAAAARGAGDQATGNPAEEADDADWGARESARRTA